MKAAACPHVDFEPVDKSPLFAGPMMRCTGCKTLWAVTTEPVQAWAKREGIGLAGDRPSSSDDEPEPF